MKRLISILTGVCIIMCLTACGGGGQSKGNSITGKWLSEDTGDVITIKDNEIELYTYHGKTTREVESTSALIKQDQADLSKFGTFTLSGDGDEMQMTCNESDLVKAGTVFKKVEDVCAKEDISVEWVDQKTGDRLTKTDSGFVLLRRVGDSDTVTDDAVEVAGDRLFIKNVSEYQIIKDGEILKIVDDKNEFVRKEDVDKVASDNKDKYQEVFDLISKETWVFNGGADTTLNYIDFKDEKAELGHVNFDGNGMHDKGTEKYEYSIDDKAITVALLNQDPLVIPYEMADGQIKLDGGAFYTLEQVKDGIQGYWRGRSTDEFGTSEENIQFDGDTIRLESAMAPQSGKAGIYNYSGPYEDSYSIKVGGFDTKMMHGGDIFYNIIGGKPVILYYDVVCSPADGFPGKEGYTF